MEESREPDRKDVPEKTEGDRAVEGQTSRADVSGQSTDQSNSSENKGDASDPRINRLKLFNKVMEKSLQRLVADASFHRFAKTFHPFYKQKPQLMESIHKQFVTELQTSIQDDIAQIMEEGNLQCKLEELDRLEEAAKDSTEPAWRPSGLPEQDLCSFVMPYYLQQREYLRREVRKVQKENAALAQRVQAGRDNIAQTEQLIAKGVEEWRASASTLEALTSLSPMQNFDIL
ncbi:polyamine-modulated factor 1 [Megalops cyprinoides]|uniref:polyamine-modulated factor 1 n=1 Tax=Megalops cyprinoides TaxID=118141 RepID=UPI001863F2F4|nr:polyamine-modulated factor 1 [Megalops cyprinoides]